MTGRFLVFGISGIFVAAGSVLASASCSMPMEDGGEREAMTASAVVASARNPIVKSIYTADPSARVWSVGRLFVYASLDVGPDVGCDLMGRYHVYSTEDMVNWRDEGEIVRASQVPWGRPEGGFMWAPDA